MSHRPILKKRGNRMRKVLRSELPAFIDLVQYLIDRKHADTVGGAEKIILAGRVRSESHKLGITHGRKLKPNAAILVMLGREEEAWEESDVVDRYVPARVRGTIQVLPA